MRSATACHSRESCGTTPAKAIASTAPSERSYILKKPIRRTWISSAVYVGADRIANAVAAETFYDAPAIVVDFGTATNIDVIDEDGYYIGGAIAPGIRISMDALAARAAKLASVPLEAPEHAIGRRCWRDRPWR